MQNFKNASLVRAGGVSVASGARKAGELAGGDVVPLARVAREQAQGDLVV